MKVEAGRYLEKARQVLAEARGVAAAGFGDAAGRGAYLAVFHAAQAFIFECTSKAAKSHKGVHSQFALLAKDEPRIDGEMRQLLPRTYDLKAIADYELGPGSSIPLERAKAAVEKAERFVALIATIISS